MANYANLTRTEQFFGPLYKLRHFMTTSLALDSPTFVNRQHSKSSSSGTTLSTFCCLLRLIRPQVLQHNARLVGHFVHSIIAQKRRLIRSFVSLNFYYCFAVLQVNVLGLEILPPQNLCTMFRFRMPSVSRLPSSSIRH